MELTVLGPLDRIAATDRQVGLSGADDDARFGIVGAGAAGRTAPIDPADVSLTYDPELLEVTGEDSGWFTVQAVAGSGSDVISATVAGEQTSVPVTVGLAEQVVADFTDADQWWYDSVPADVDGLVAPADGRDGPGVRCSVIRIGSSTTREPGSSP